MPKFLPSILARPYSNPQSQSLFIHNVNDSVCLIQHMVHICILPYRTTRIWHATQDDLLNDEDLIILKVKIKKCETHVSF